LLDRSITGRHITSHDFRSPRQRQVNDGSVHSRGGRVQLMDLLTSAAGLCRPKTSPPPDVVANTNEPRPR
jgi:hypothetical protein